MEILKKIRQMLCRHTWKTDEEEWQTGYFSRGKEYSTKYYICNKCDKKKREDIFVKDHWEDWERKEW